MSQTQSKSALRRKNFEGICRRCEQTRPLRLAEYDKDRKVLTLK